MMDQLDTSGAEAASPKAATAAPPPAIQSYIDGLDPRWNAVGWAWLPGLAGLRLKVELLEGGKLLATDIAERFRGDLLDAKMGDGKYGFQLAIPGALFDGERHNFTVQATGQDVTASIGQLNIMLPSRLPKAAGAKNISRIVDTLLGAPAAPSSTDLDDYILEMEVALGKVAFGYDYATAMGLLYIHILGRRIDEGGLQSRLTRLSQNPEQLGDVVREVVESDEARASLRSGAGYRLPSLDVIHTWTRLRSFT